MNTVCCFFTIWNLKSARTSYKCGRVELSRTSGYYAISKLILQFSYSFHVSCIIFPHVYFHIVLSMFPFLFHGSQSKTDVVNQTVHSCFCKTSTIGQLNVQLQLLQLNTPWITWYTLNSKNAVLLPEVIWGVPTV